MDRTMPKTANKDGLNHRQRTLVEVLPACNWHIPTAGIKAGYAPAYANTHLADNVKKNQKLCEAIERRRRETAERAAVTAEEVIAGLRRIAYDPKATNADRLRAFELLGKTAALFTDKVLTATEDLRIVLRRPVDAEVVDESLDQRPRLRLRHAAQSPQTAE